MEIFNTKKLNKCPFCGFKLYYTISSFIVVEWSEGIDLFLNTTYVKSCETVFHLPVKEARTWNKVYSFHKQRSYNAEL